MLDPVKVWMVRLERGSAAAELEGRLQMRPDALLFTSTPGEQTLIRFERALTARRLRGSPVLMITWVEEGRRTRTAFYFAKPPPLKPPDRLERSNIVEMAWMGRKSPRRQRRENVGYLSTHAGTLKPLLGSWASECAQRIRRAKGAEEGP